MSAGSSVDVDIDMHQNVSFNSKSKHTLTLQPIQTHRMPTPTPTLRLTSKFNSLPHMPHPHPIKPIFPPSAYKNTFPCSPTPTTTPTCTPLHPRPHKLENPSLFRILTHKISFAHSQIKIKAMIHLIGHPQNLIRAWTNRENP